MESYEIEWKLWDTNTPKQWKVCLHLCWPCTVVIYNAFTISKYRFAIN